MQFNDTSNNDGIIQMIEYTTEKGLASISGNTNELKYFTNLVNQWYRKVAGWIFKASKDWSYDDSNKTDFPIAKTTLVDGQSDYSLPTGLLKIRKVEILDTDGNYVEIKRIKTTDPRLKSEFLQEDKGFPNYYWTLGRSIFLYARPDANSVTVTNGLRITFERDVTAFVSTDTTKEPGFKDQFHPILYYGPSMEWALIKGEATIVQACRLMIFGDGGKDLGLKGELEKDYSDQDQNDQNILQSDSMLQNYGE